MGWARSVEAPCSDEERSGTVAQRSRVNRAGNNKAVRLGVGSHGNGLDSVERASPIEEQGSSLRK